MSQLPMNPQSSEQQQKLMGQLYLLMERQVKSYHRHNHMGTNSSVPVELARELMESIEYTVNQVGGFCACPDIEEAMKLGQGILEEKLARANAMLVLVKGTAPHWQNECRWDALRCLEGFLNRYDHRHLAHKGPDALFYPILISPPEGIQGIDTCLFYLNILWIENQILAGVPEEALEAFWDRLPPVALNQCEQVLLNGIGKAMIGHGLDPLTFGPDEYTQLIVAMLGVTEEKLRAAAKRLCQWLDLKDENANDYVQAVVPQLRMWIGENLRGGTIENIFL